MPGRPRKWSLVDPIQPAPVQPPQPQQYYRQDSQYQSDNHAHNTGLRARFDDRTYAEETASLLSFGKASTSVRTTDPTASTDNITNEPQGWTPQDGDVAYSGDEFGASLPFLDFDTSGQLNSLPLDSFRACLSNNHLGLSTAAQPTSPPLTPKSCYCARQVFDIIRALNRGVQLHDTLSTLRQGASLFETLLVCPICYDVSKPPRVTLQNVLLIGRLVLEVLTHYRKYLRWLRDHCTDTSTESSETIHLPSTVALIRLSISRTKLYDIVRDGLKDDAARLSDLGKHFETRQMNRHLIGHGACPDKEGRCWREQNDMDPDASDICPQSSAARALIPCYRVVDEVRAKIDKFEEALAKDDD